MCETNLFPTTPLVSPVKTGWRTRQKRRACPQGKVVGSPGRNNSAFLLLGFAWRKPRTKGDNVKRTIQWRLTKAQKEAILRAIVYCPTDVQDGDEELQRHRANSAQVRAELEQLGWDDSLWEYLNSDTRRKAKAR